MKQITSRIQHPNRNSVDEGVQKRKSKRNIFIKPVNCKKKDTGISYLTWFSLQSYKLQNHGSKILNYSNS